MFTPFWCSTHGLCKHTVRLEHTDKKLLEMARVFSIPMWKRIHYIYVPALLPYLVNGCRTALGMSWKSGVAAEVIGIPEGSIGEQLYYSKLYLTRPDSLPGPLSS